VLFLPLPPPAKLVNHGWIIGLREISTPNRRAESSYVPSNDINARLTYFPKCAVRGYLLVKNQAQHLINRAVRYGIYEAMSFSIITKRESLPDNTDIKSRIYYLTVKFLPQISHNFYVRAFTEKSPHALTA
jgi:hypothetical protein